MNSSNSIGLPTFRNNLMSQLISRYLLVVLAGVAFHLPAHAQPSYGTLPKFTLKDSNNELFQKNDLRGKVWLAHTFFTSCPSVCPTIIGDIKKLISGLPPKHRPSVMSITVDPQTDTTDRLAEYAKKRGLQDHDWKFITGHPASIISLIENGLRIAGPENTPDAHSPRIVLIDKAGQIRGFYLATDPLDFRRLNEDLVRLSLGNPGA